MGNLTRRFDPKVRSAENHEVWTVCGATSAKETGPNNSRTNWRLYQDKPRGLSHRKSSLTSHPTANFIPRHSSIPPETRLLMSDNCRILQPLLFSFE